MVKILENIQKYLLYLLVLLFPVFVLPFFENPYTVPKEILLVVLMSATIILWMARTISSGSFTFKVGKFDFAVLLIGLSYLLSAIIKTPNKMEAFFFPGTVTFVLGAVVLYYLVNQLDKKGKTGVAYSLLLSGILLSVSSLFTEIGFWAKIPQLPAFIKDPGFIAFGGNLPAVIYLISIFVLSFALIFKENDYIKKLFVGVSAAVILLGIIILGKNALPGRSQAVALPDFQTSWEVSVETLKQSPFFGVGPANYLTAFSLFRPISYNQTSLWQTRFTTARDFYLTAITELGFVGVFAFVVLFATAYKVIIKGLKFNLEPQNLASLIEKIALIILAVIFLFLPGTPNLMILLFVLLALLSLSEEKSVSLVTSSRAAGILISLPFAIGLVALGYFGVKAVSAEYKYKLALNALVANNAQLTYDSMQSAVTGQNNVDRYHASFAQVDMALATSLANKKDITDADKSTITQLVQQAVNEGKATVILNPQRSGNWEMLGQIYRNIMSYATGADQFAIQTFTQAVALDPTNPNLRIELGGVYYALGRYDDAIDTFKLATLAKSDLANAYYNLSAAYAAKKDYTNAIAAMNTVLTLVPKDSSDYKLAQSALTDLQKQVPATTTTKTTDQQSQLTAPQPVPASNVKPPITLPKEATPPASQ